MGGVSAAHRASAIESNRSIVEPSEQSFGEVQSVLSSISRTLWPAKTAAHLAAAANCSVRAAEFYLAGEREYSGDAIAAIIAEIMRRHGARNLKVLPKR
jgi:hypothetical protein